MHSLLPTRNGISRTLDEVNVIIRRARDLQSQGVRIPGDKSMKGLSPAHRMGATALKQAGRMNLHRMKSSELRPMDPGLYFAASDAIMAILAGEYLPPETRRAITSSWVRVNDEVRRG